MWKVPLSDVDVGEPEIAAVTEVLRSKWLTMGEVTRRFERTFSERIGVRHAFAVANGTAALELAYRVAGVEAGDEVVMPSLSFVASANAAVVRGATPVFADITSDDDLNVSTHDLAAKITPRTRALCVVHYGGYPCDMTALTALARERGVMLIEDCAHAPGASIGGAGVGSLGDLGCFSFFSNKNMTTGEGGMVTTNRDDFAERLRLLRSHGMTTLTLDRHQGHAFSYDVLEAGHNFRLDELRSAIGLAQLAKLEAANARRGERVARYRALLGEVRGLRMPFAGREAGAAFHLATVLLDDEARREHFMTGMREAGIQTSIHYPPIHQFQYYSTRFPTLNRLPRTEAVAPRLVTLPLHPGLSVEDQALVARTAAQLLA